MTFPFGPFRNAGDFRLWAVASVVWLILSGIYSFQVNPPTTDEEQVSSAQFDCMWRHVGASDTTKAALSACYGGAVFAADENHYGSQVTARVFLIMILPPIALAVVIWIAIETVGWIKRGYVE